MRKLAILLTLVFVLLSVLSVVSFAADETEMSTTITYMKSEPSPSEPEQPTPPEPEKPSTPATGTYEINIPASISLSGSDDLYITANYINLEDADKAVVVAMDGKSFDNDKIVWLTNSGSDKIGVTLYRQHTDGEYSQVGNGSPVAFFNDGDTTPSIYGTLRMVASSEDIATAQPGIYSGTVYFSIYIVDK